MRTPPVRETGPLGTHHAGMSHDALDEAPHTWNARATASSPLKSPTALLEDTIARSVRPLDTSTPPPRSRTDASAAIRIYVSLPTQMGEGRTPASRMPW